MCIIQDWAKESSKETKTDLVRGVGRKLAREAARDLLRGVKRDLVITECKKGTYGQRYLDPWMHESMDPWIHGSTDPWSMDPWIHRSMDRSMDQWIQVPLAIGTFVAHREVRGAERDWARDMARDMARQATKEVNGEVLRAVSYTHLTLPTKA